MVRANIADLKNRLSHYLRLVKGGATVEILDRQTPLARIEPLGKVFQGRGGAVWVQEMIDLGIVIAPKQEGPSAFLADPDQVVSCQGRPCGALDALLDERKESR